MLKLKALLSKILTALPKDYGGTVKNLNILLDTGVGYTNGATGQPPNVSNGTILVFKNTGLTTQIYIPYSQSAIYARVYIGGTWQTWKQL